MTAARIAKEAGRLDILALLESDQGRPRRSAYVVKIVSVEMNFFFNFYCCY